jgi:predicted O-methyltransferase YrrM
MDIDVIFASADSDAAVDSALAVAWKTLSEFHAPVSQRNELFVYFKSLDEVLMSLCRSGEVESVEAAMIHVEYLAEKAGCISEVILCGEHFTADSQVIQDALANIGDVLRGALQKRVEGPSEATPGVADSVTSVSGNNDAADSVADSGGALESALVMAWQTLSGIGVSVPQSGDHFAYFKALDDVLVALTRSGGVAAVEAAMPHVEYLAGKADCIPAVILGGRQFTAHPQVILEALANIGGALRGAFVTPAEQLPEGIPAEVFALILEAEAKLAGWCSREKALVIARIVLQERPVTCVEIGVFGGRSLVPCAAALRHIGAGAIYGIEAWSPNVAIENATNDVNDEWWSKVDFAQIKRAFYQFVAETNLTQHVRVIEAPSGRAAMLFDEIDFLHIDGSHSVLNAAQDVLLYASRVRSGGIVVFDDVNWQSTAPARELLAALCDTVAVLKDPESGLDICAVFRRR